MYFSMDGLTRINASRDSTLSLLLPQLRIEEAALRICKWKLHICRIRSLMRYETTQWTVPELCYPWPVPQLILFSVMILDMPCLIHHVTRSTINRCNMRYPQHVFHILIDTWSIRYDGQYTKWVTRVDRAQSVTLIDWSMVPSILDCLFHAWWSPRKTGGGARIAIGTTPRTATQLCDRDASEFQGCWCDQLYDAFGACTRVSLLMHVPPHSHLSHWLWCLLK